MQLNRGWCECLNISWTLVQLYQFTCTELIILDHPWSKGEEYWESFNLFIHPLNHINNILRKNLLNMELSCWIVYMYCISINWAASFVTLHTAHLKNLQDLEKTIVYMLWKPAQQWRIQVWVWEGRFQIQWRKLLNITSKPFRACEDSYHKTQSYRARQLEEKDKTDGWIEAAFTRLRF